MSGIQLISVISENGQDQRCMDILRAHGAALVQVSAGLGTATGDMLRLLGLSRTDKHVAFALCAEHNVQDTMTALVAGSQAMAFSTSLSSISVPLFRQEEAGSAQKREGASPMNEGTKYEVVIVMANRGYIDLVMDAARTAGAGGGTVIHARGTGEGGGEQFFGVTLAEERDIFFIVTPATDRVAIMQAIVKEAGLHTPAKAAVFSMPIQHLAGFPKYSAKNIDKK